LKVSRSFTAGLADPWSQDVMHKRG